MKTIVFDIETIPDYTTWFDLPKTNGKPEQAEANAAANPLAPPAPAKRGRKPKAEGEKFPPIWAHQVAAIGYVVMEDGKAEQIGAMPAADVAGESLLLRGFAEFAGTADRLVTWNGRGFDLPVIKTRSYHHGIPQTWANGVKRYDGDRHADMFDILSDYGVRGITGYSLDTFARLIGLPGKEGDSGALVAAMAKAGQWEEILAYCKRDTVQTAYVYLRYSLLIGNITADEYRENAKALRAAWEPDPAFKGWKIDAARLELGA